MGLAGKNCRNLVGCEDHPKFLFACYNNNYFTIKHEKYIVGYYCMSKTPFVRKRSGEKGTKIKNILSS